MIIAAKLRHVGVAVVLIMTLLILGYYGVRSARSHRTRTAIEAALIDSALSNEVRAEPIRVPDGTPRITESDLEELTAIARSLRTIRPNHPLVEARWSLIGRFDEPIESVQVVVARASGETWVYLSVRGSHSAKNSWNVSVNLTSDELQNWFVATAAGRYVVRLVDDR